MGLFNPAAIKGLTDELKNKTDNGEVFKQSAIGDGEMVELKLLKPQPNQGGEYNYVVPTLTYWLNKKPFLVNTWKGGADVIEEELKEARELGDPSVNALLASDKFRKSESFLFPALVIKTEYREGDICAVTSVHPKRIFEATVSVLNSINEIVVHPAVIAKGKGYGVFHPELGYTVTVSRTGKEKATRYSVQKGEQVDCTEHADPSKTPDIMAYLEKMGKSDTYLRLAIRNFLYGEEMPETDNWKGVTKATATPTPQAPAPTTPRPTPPANKQTAAEILAAEHEALDDELNDE